MNPIVTNRQALLGIVQGTLDALHSQSFSANFIESVAPAEGEQQRIHRDNVINALSAALDWARLEKKPDDTVVTESPGAAEPYIPSNQALSLLQSAYEDYLDERTQAPPTDLEVPFDTFDPGWATIVLAKMKALFRGKHPFVKHTSGESFRFDLPEKCSVALFGDWGTGEPTAIRVMQQIRAAAPDFAVHLGDIYYSGTEKEVTERFLKIIEQNGPPIRRDSGQAGCRYFALPGNHDMYSGGYGYYDLVLSRFGQPASYFNLRNAFWQLIGLDSAYEDFGLQDPQGDWLEVQLQQAGSKNILMSHHQFLSPYETRAQNRTLAGKTRKFLPLVHSWFWGHEHRCIVFKKSSGIKPRCIGHGAIPTPVPFGPPKFPVPIEKMDERPGPDGCEIHGFAMLRFDGPQLDVSYQDEFGNEFFSETL